MFGIIAVLGQSPTWQLLSGPSDEGWLAEKASETSMVGQGGQQATQQPPDSVQYVLASTLSLSGWVTLDRSLSPALPLFPLFPPVEKARQGSMTPDGT